MRCCAARTRTPRSERSTPPWSAESAGIAELACRAIIVDYVVSLEAGGDYLLRVGTAEFGNGTTTVHTQIAATVLGTAPERIAVHQSDTDAVEHDTGVFGSAGTVPGPIGR